MPIERITGIVTDIVRHNDRHNIVTLFTRSRGRISFLSSASQGKAGRARNARLQLLAIVESDVNFKESKTLQTLASISTPVIWRDIYFNPVKSAMVMFISEFLNRYLRDASPEPLLWDYVVHTMSILDSRRGPCSNFHISFLVGFLQFAGITPDTHDYEAGDIFDMQGGQMVAYRPAHSNFLPPDETSFLPKLLRMNFDNDRCFRFRVGERRIILSKLLQYYAVHFPGMANLRSPEILAEVFS